MKRWRIMTLALCASLLLSGCGLRTRIAPEATHETAAPGETTGHAQGAGMAWDEESAAAHEGEQPAGDAAAEQEPDPAAPTVHREDAAHREFAEHVSAALEHDAAHQAAVQAEGEMLPAMAAEGGKMPEDQVQAAADLTLTERRPLTEAEELAVSEQGRVADSVLQYYQALLSTRAGSLFECQRLYVYWETAQEHQTVHKSSAEHTVIALAGGYDVAVKRPEDALTVDEGWVSRKEPGCLVKAAPADTTAAQAAAIRAAWLGKPAWQAIPAVRASCVLVLNERLLESAAGQTAAALLLAVTMYPQSYAELDVSAALEELLGPADGGWIYTN